MSAQKKVPDTSASPPKEKMAVDGDHLEGEPPLLYAMPLADHLTELLARIATACLLPLVTAGLCFLPVESISSVFCSLACGGLETNTDVSPSGVLDRVLWSIFFAGFLFHYTLLHQSWAFVSAGLYPNEKRIMSVPIFWTHLIPEIVLVIMILFSHAVRIAGADLLAHASCVRAWAVRFYLLTALATLLLSLPRRTRSLHPLVFTGVLGLIYFLPDHIFETLLIALAESWILGLACCIAGLKLLATMKGGRHA